MGIVDKDVRELASILFPALTPVLISGCSSGISKPAQNGSFAPYVFDRLKDF
jgi:hypothetical protein